MSIKGAINYNENKVKQGQAGLLLAQGYSKEPGQLNFHQKLNRLQKLTELNYRTKTNCLHLSLNFDPTEKISSDKLIAIAEAYVNKIGYGRQPYLVYEHFDAAHQHLHIVTTNIQRDGKRISLHNLGKEKSEIARKEIETAFGLVKASDRQNKIDRPLKPASLQKVQYGIHETKRTIANIVTNVLQDYKFTSFPEFNAVLRQFNVVADRGTEGSRLFLNKGILYAIIDEKGKMVGVPIKASSIYGKPTLNNIEQRYTVNENLRQNFREEVRGKIMQASTNSTSYSSFINNLQANQIGFVERRNAKDLLYGVTYIDHETKTVFNGSDLGKALSAAAIRERWRDETQNPGEEKQMLTVLHKHIQANDPNIHIPDITENIITSMIQPSETLDYVPYQLKKKRKKRRRKL